MKCPLKFARYEFEGGTDCIGAECGFYGCVCDATNGIDGETNGIADEITLSEGNELTAKIGEITEAASELMKKQPYTFDIHDVPGSIKTAERYIDELRAERDELQTKLKEYDRIDREAVEICEGCKLVDEWKAKYEGQASLAGRSSASYLRKLDECEELERERDEWKANAKTFVGYSKHWREKCEKLEHRSDKRAAAVERLRKMRHVDDYGDWVEAIAEVVKGTDKSNIGDYGMWESLIDLLTDDDAHSTTGNMTEQSESLSDANDDFTPESVVTPEAVDANDANATQDSREKLEADVRQILHSAYMLAWMHGYENRRGSSFEKLHREFYNLLDRQAAIVEREWQESNDRLIATMRTTSEQYREKIAELTEQLEAAHVKNRALKLHISKMQAGRHGWHVKGVELQRQVDELTAQLHASNAERARLRECLGIATDHVHDFLTLVDESDNVYDRDEGLA